MPNAPKLGPVHPWEAKDLSCAHSNLTDLYASQWVVHRKSMCKSHIYCGKWLSWCFGYLIDLQRWSAKESDQVTCCNQHGRPWEIWIFFFRKCWDSWHLMWSFENSWWPPPTLTLTPKISKNNYHCCGFLFLALRSRVELQQTVRPCRPLHSWTQQMNSRKQLKIPLSCFITFTTVLLAKALWFNEGPKKNCSDLLIILWQRKRPDLPWPA